MLVTVHAKTFKSMNCSYYATFLHIESDLLRYYLCTVRYTTVVDLRPRMLINNQNSLSFSLRLSFTETSHLYVNRARFIPAGFFQLYLPTSLYGGL